jgi:UDP-2-acetamido-2-deoxy-ribo-hexuluronate aminotransferase
MQQKIQMVDLKTQYLKIKPEIDNAIFSILESTTYIKGESVKIFEDKLSKFLDVKHAISCANGTDALQIALMGLGLSVGDEIITSSFTFIATAEVIALLKLTPVLVDVDPGTFCINPVEIEKKITSKTKVIIPVQLFGQCSDMNRIMQIAEKYNLYIIEDAAQSLGSEYTFDNGVKKMAGTMGTVGTTSFFPSKNLGCFGDGGAMLTNDDKLAEHLRSISNHGMKKRYYHDLIGVNSRLDTLQASILNVKLDYLESYNKSRQDAASYYDSRFIDCKHLTIPYRNSSSTHIFHQYTLLMDKEENFKMVEYLKTKDIPSMVYYPVPIHLQKAYQVYGYKTGDLPVTEKLCKRVFSLPMHSELTTEQQNIIIENVLNYFK